MTQIDKARKERDARQRRLRLAKFAVAALLAIVVTTISIGFLDRRAQRNKAVVAEQKLSSRSSAAWLAEEKQEAESRSGSNRAESSAEEQEGIAVKQQQDRRRAERSVAAEQAAGSAEDQTKIAVEQSGAEEQSRSPTERKRKQARKNTKPTSLRSVWRTRRSTTTRTTTPATARSEQAGAAELGMGPAGASCAGWALANYKAAAPVVAVAYSPDGKSFVTGDQDGKVTVRDAQTGDVRFQAPHGQYVLSVAYSPDGKQIAAGSSDKTIQIFDAATGRAIGHAIARATPMACSRCGFRPMAGSFSAARTTTRPACGTSPRARRCKNSRATAGGSGRPSSRRMPIESSPPARTARRLCGKSGRQCKLGSMAQARIRR